MVYTGKQAAEIGETLFMLLQETEIFNLMFWYGEAAKDLRFNEYQRSEFSKWYKEAFVEARKINAVTHELFPGKLRIYDGLRSARIEPTNFILDIRSMPFSMNLFSQKLFAVKEQREDVLTAARKFEGLPERVTHRAERPTIGDLLRDVKNLA